MDTKTISLRMDQIFSNFIKKGRIAESNSDLYVKVGDQTIRFYMDQSDYRGVVAGEKKIENAYITIESSNMNLGRHSGYSGINRLEIVLKNLGEEISFSKTKKNLVSLLNLAEKLSKPKKVRRARSRLSIIIINGVKYKKAK